jgi:integrase
MAIVKAPLKTDTAGKCSRWRVIVYNPRTGKQDWHTVEGTRRDAQVYERKQKTRLASKTYIAKSDRRTFEQVAEMFLREREIRNRRTSTLVCYKTVLDCHLMPKDKNGIRGGFAQHKVDAISRQDIAEHLDAMRAAGKPVATINRALRTMKAILFFALERELVERPVMQRFRPYEGGDSKRGVNRGTFTEGEVQSLLAAAKPYERALISLLCFTGLRPGEAYALDWSAVDLERGSLRVERSWDHRGRKFVEPKTRAGVRVLELSVPLVAELKAHQERSGGKGLVFANGNGKALNPSNVRRDIWLKLVKRAGVRALDLYSLRHTFASIGRTAGESAFNMARFLGHSRSVLIDQVYAHSLQSGMANISENVTARALGIKPQFRVIEGGKSRDVREPLENRVAEQTKEAASA